MTDLMLQIVLTRSLQVATGRRSFQYQLPLVHCSFLCDYMAQLAIIVLFKTVDLAEVAGNRVLCVTFVHLHLYLVSSQIELYQEQYFLLLLLTQEKLRRVYPTFPQLLITLTFGLILPTLFLHLGPLLSDLQPIHCFLVAIDDFGLAQTAAPSILFDYLWLEGALVYLFLDPSLLSLLLQLLTTLILVILVQPRYQLAFPFADHLFLFPGTLRVAVLFAFLLASLALEELSTDLPVILPRIVLLAVGLWAQIVES